MAIITGAQFDHYEILAPLGAGGMGEVWRARDTRLNREVAIKVLPADIVQDAERLRRFEQEARATSALNHPNILTVYDFAMHEGNPYLVMELLEGEELRQQRNEGPLPVRKAIDYAQQIASGLAAAHEKGIVHRDLKPENLFVTTEGRVKILDFGLAKLRPLKSESKGSEASTQKQLTDPGTVMGTVSYMSPEQVRGQQVDHRSDIFSFGTILYEMLSGKRPFKGESQVEVMNAILKEDPTELSETNSKIPLQLEKIVKRCLEKRPERRFQAASDLGFALEASTTPSGARVETVMLPVKVTSVDATRRWKWAALALGTIALVLSTWLIFRSPPSLGDAPMTLLEITPPHRRFAFQPAPAISPDGRHIAFWALDEAGKDSLWVRSLDTSLARILPGTAVDVNSSGFLPFWSPDGRSLGFFADGKLKRIDLAGGNPLTLADASNPRGGSWSADGVIIFVPTGNLPYRVSASGGEATPLKLSTPSNNFCHWPHFLPDGRHFFMTCGTSTAITGGFVAALDSQEVRQLSKVESRMEYANGYVFYGHHGGLFAQPFDDHQLALSGQPVRIADSLGFNSGNLISYAFSVSPQRNLVYWGGTFLPLTQLTWFSRAGQRLSTVGEPGENLGFALSPTGQQVVIEQHDPKTNVIDLWLMDSATGVGSKFTTGLGAEQWSQTPIWSPTDERLLFMTPSGVMAKPLRSGETEPLVTDANLLLATSLLDISADGHYALLGKDDPVTGSDFLLLQLTGERTLKPYLQTKHNELTARFSPDSHWIAYVSDESGNFEVYVQSFPDAGRKVRISGNGGNRPEWRKDGKELYYIAPEGKLMAVAVNSGGSDFQISAPQRLPVNILGESTRKQYHPSTDGTRFLVNARVEDREPRALTMALNWTAEMKK